MKLKWEFDIACYYNLWCAPYFHDEHLDVKNLRSELRRKDFIIQGLENFSALFQRLEAGYRRAGMLHRKNLGHSTHSISTIGFLDDLRTPRPRKQVLRTTEAIFNATRASALDLLADLGETPVPADRTLPLYEFMLATPLA